METQMEHRVSILSAQEDLIKMLMGRTHRAIHLTDRQTVSLTRQGWCTTRCTGVVAVANKFCSQRVKWVESQVQVGAREDLAHSDQCPIVAQSTLTTPFTSRLRIKQESLAVLETWLGRRRERTQWVLWVQIHTTQPTKSSSNRLDKSLTQWWRCKESYPTIQPWTSQGQIRPSLQTKSKVKAWWAIREPSIELSQKVDWTPNLRTKATNSNRTNKCSHHRPTWGTTRKARIN